MKKFLFVPILIIVFFSHFNPVFSQNCDVLISESITLINNARNAFSEGNTALGNAYLDGAQALLRPCIDQNPTCPITSIIDIINQTRTAPNDTVRITFLDTINTLIGVCVDSPPIITTTNTPVSRSVSFVGMGTFVNGVAISNNNQFVATNSSDYSIRVWNATTGDELYQLDAFEQTNLGMATAFSLDDAYLATSDFSGNVILWDYQARTVLYSWNHTGYVWHVEFSPTATTLASVGSDGFLKLYNTRTGREIRSLRYNNSPLRGLAFSPNGRQILVSAEEGTVILWDADTGERLMVMSGHTTIANDVAFSPEGNRAASIDNNGLMIIWDLTNGSEITRVSAHTRQAFSLLWLPDTNRIITGSDDGYLRVWDGTTYDQLAEYNFEGLYIRAVDYTVDESAILLGMNNGTVTLFPIAP